MTRLVERISRLVLSHDKVLGIHDLLVHDYGPGQCYASVHVELSAQEDPLVCPCCGQSVRATKAVNILCGDCLCKMVEA